MIRNFTDTGANFKANIYFKDCSKVLGKDIPPKIGGDSERNVTYWESDTVLCVVPMSEVKKIEIYIDKEN